MAITEQVDNFRYILPIAHNIEQVDHLPPQRLRVSRDLDLAQIAVCRFRLISALFLKNHTLDIHSKILIIGYGCVGYACHEELKSRGFEKISVLTRHKKLLKINYVDSKVLNKNNFDTIIDTTGNSDAINQVITNMQPRQTLVLLGTPRQSPNIDLLQVHRLNLTIIGAHELNGYSDAYRQQAFDEVVTNVYNNKIKYNDVVEEINQHIEDIEANKKIYTVIRK